MATVYLGLGSNIDAERNLRFAVGQLRHLYGELTVSPVYRSRAVGFDGPDFLNLVVALSTDATPLEVLNEIETIAFQPGYYVPDRDFGRYPIPDPDRIKEKVRSMIAADDAGPAPAGELATESECD